jgi:hypothetical protein
VIGYGENMAFMMRLILRKTGVASSYLAIDQGPIVIMIENYRTGLLWDNFMTATEIKNGLDKLGFNY